MPVAIAKNEFWREQEALKRFQIISPLLQPDLDTAKQLQLRKELAEQHNLSVRTLYRYEKAYREQQFSGLKSTARKAHNSKKLPANYDDLLQEAILLKREVPERSVRQIILILELEGRVAPDVLKRSTLQRHLYEAGYGRAQLQMCKDARQSSSKRFCKPHRMMLIQGDIKYGYKLPIGKNGAKVQVYLSSALDDHSRFPLASQWYDNQEENAVEDTFRKAVTRYGKFDACYFDNGKQYVARQLKLSLFDMQNMPFVRSVPVSALYKPAEVSEALGRLGYTAEKQLFAVVTGDSGIGKSTLIRKFDVELPKDKYLLLYLSDSKLTPRWFYAGMLDQLGMEAKFYRGDSKRLLQKEIEILRRVQSKKVVCVLDEAHLLERETLEEFRFMLNYRFDSESPMALILVGQTELWEQKLRLQRYAAIRQRIDVNIVLHHMDRADTERYIAAQLAYAAGQKDIFTDRAMDEIYKLSTGIPRMINRICEKALMYAAQQKKHLVDDLMVRFVAEHEMLIGGDAA